MINLPVSIGEALDKLSILEIKVEKLPEDRKIYAMTEYDLLLKEIKNYADTNNILYYLLKKINLIIWDEMDLLRDKYETMTEKEYHTLCKKCIDDNDKRFRIKKKINNFFSSCIKEQKSYNKMSLLLYLPKINNDDYYNKIIQYFSVMYDEVSVILGKNNYDSIKKNFDYDNDIKFIEINEINDFNDFNDINKIYKNFRDFIYDDTNISFDYGKKLSLIEIDKNYL